MADCTITGKILAQNGSAAQGTISLHPANAGHVIRKSPDVEVGSLEVQTASMTGSITVEQGVWAIVVRPYSKSDPGFPTLSRVVDLQTLTTIDWDDIYAGDATYSPPTTDSTAVRAETAAAAAEQSATDAQTAATAAEQAAASASAPTDAMVASLIPASSGSQTNAALVAEFGGGSGGGVAASAANDLSPLIVPTYDVVGSYNAAPGARTGLATVFMTGGGYTTEHRATGVSGTAGEYTLTVADTTTLATLDGDGSKTWDAIVENGDGRCISVAIRDVSGGTCTLAQPLPITITGGSLGTRVDEPAGQHLSLLATKALAQRIAAANPVVGTRGGILDGTWDTLPAAQRIVWQANAALTAYGVKSSSDGGPTVMSVVTDSSTGSVFDSNGGPTTIGLMLRAVFGASPGHWIGCHTAGHGGTCTLTPAGRPVVIEFATSAQRTSAVTVGTARIQVTATIDDGTVIYDRTVGPSLLWHRIPVSGAQTVTLAVTNTDGSVYYLHPQQTTMREAGTGGQLAPRKALLFGDSWTTFYTKALGPYLAEALDCEVVTYGLGGTTSTWGLWWLDTALAENPGCDTIIILFGTNDLNNNQNSTAPHPTLGSGQLQWPNGLTTAQAEALWSSQIKALASRAQQRGLRPVIVAPGGVNVLKQFPGAAHLEQPPLVDWSASVTELADPANYVNRVGKTAGTAVRVGGSVKYAQGPAPADPWKNPAEENLELLQRATMPRSRYSRANIPVGTDTNSDGVADGFDKWTVGTPSAGDVWTPSIVTGRQRIATTWDSTGTATYRTRFYFDATAAHDYLIIFDLVNATAGGTYGNSFTNVTGSSKAFSAAEGSNKLPSGQTAGQIYYRGTADATANKYAALGPNRLNGTTNTHDIASARVIDLTALLTDAPNLANKTTAQLVDFILAMQG